MRFRLTSIDELQFLTCLKHQLWGSRTYRFKDWKDGDYLGFQVEKTLAGLAKVSGKPFKSKQRVWDNDIFPNRISLKFVHVMLPEHRPAVLGEIRDALTSAWGPRYGWGILNQQLLTSDLAEVLTKAIYSQPNNLKEIQASIELYLDEAKLQRDIEADRKRKRGRPKTKPPIDKEPIGPEEDSAHTRFQGALVRLGKASRCSVWVASNDRNRIYKGKKLGEGCLKSLPSFGLSDEAARLISYIDVIWIYEDTPICAFEVETTTSIYSGLLRMSDLLSLVPALKIKLFTVAPKERQRKFMDEIDRPTFRKIGLSDYCRFIVAEELEDLVQRVEVLKGHVLPTMVDNIAVELEEESI